MNASRKGSRMTSDCEGRGEKKFRLYVEESGTVAETKCVQKVALVEGGREES